jgi:hypothetical protein
VARIRVSGFRHSGFPGARNLHRWIRDSRIPEADVAAWVPEIQWSTGGVKPIDRRFGTRGLVSKGSTSRVEIPRG